MNFLSHFYFERFHRDPEIVLGSVFPDLLKNAEPALHIHPYKHELSLLHNPKLKELYQGWQRHLEIDRHFHGAPFFYDHVHELKILLQPHVQQTDIRPSFMAHVGLELLLDHLLLKQALVDDQHFYGYLEQVDRAAVKKFLNACGVPDTVRFFEFYDAFLKDRYVSTYRDLGQVARALNHICKRLWTFDLSRTQTLGIEGALEQYVSVLEPDYKRIFDEIEAELW